MKWGISFNVPAAHKADLWGLPPPSQMWETQRWDGAKVINVLYHFLHTPQSRKEWQRVAGIKVQIANMIECVEFPEYEPVEVEGKVYTVSELGKYFKAFVKFPAPYFDGTPQAILTRHAKRLHYEGKLHVEQLIFASMWVKETAPKGEAGRRKKDEGMRQVMKRAISAYRFALDHLEEWPVKLGEEERHNVLSQSALKAAEAKRDKSKEKRDRVKSFRSQGKPFAFIAKELGVSLATAKRYAKA